jgi:hypothetical protein
MLTKEFAIQKIQEITNQKTPWRKPQFWVIQSKETRTKPEFYGSKEDRFGPFCWS